MRSRRMYRSHRLYEICFRANLGLPLAPRPLINLIIQSSIARTQRDDKVQICSQVWMGNHPHLIVCSLDVENFKLFYEELKKRITDCIKRLVGRKHLSIWDGSTTAAEILDVDAAVGRFKYGFLNPARAGLVDSIEEYPGVNSWEEFKAADASVNACVETEVPWIRLTSIPRLSSANPSKREEQRVIKAILEANKHMHKLKIYPFAWLKVFGITEPQEIEIRRQQVLFSVREVEQELRIERARLGKRTIGRERLMSQGITWNHTPAKKERRISFISSIKELRTRFLEEFSYFCDRCRECLKKLRLGFTDIDWPLGAFRPAIRPLANPI